MRRLLAVVVLLGTFGCGCDRLVANIDLERMIAQQKCEAYEVCTWLPQGRTLQTPPPGTVPRHRLVGNPALTEGMVDGQHVDVIPVAVDETFLARGRERFEIFCAACHGVLGYGNPPVAENMRLVQPPSLHTTEVVEYPPGHLYRMITYGWGLMPAYAEELDLADRWAVVAYLRALQLSQATALADLPPPLREEAREELP